MNAHYKGGSTFNLAGAGTNVARCGAFPENVELSFTGSGIDTEGVLNNAVFSACTNTTTGLVSDLKAIDTYVQSGDQVFIEGDPFVQTVNPVTCVATNARRAFPHRWGYWSVRGRDWPGPFPHYEQLNAVQRAHASCAGLV